MENQYWLYFSWSLGVFVVCTMFMFYCVEKGRITSSINTERERARSHTPLLLLTQNSQGPEKFRKDIEPITQATTIFLGISASLAVAAAIASFSAERKRPASIVVSLFSALPTLCFFMFLKRLSDVKLDHPQGCSSEEQDVKTEALFRVFVLRIVGHHLLSFAAALCVGWIHPIPMFVATAVMMLVYIAIDVKASTVKSQKKNQILPLQREDPIRSRTLNKHPLLRENPI